MTEPMLRDWLARWLSNARAPLGDAAVPMFEQVDRPLPDLLAEALAICRSSESPMRPPIRLVHHMACTGGTLISRCIAALPNVRLLSEVDPLSPLKPLDPSHFVPADLVGLAKYGSRPPTPEVLVEAFFAGIDVLQEDSRRIGMDLVLRDHVHGHFHYGKTILDRPTLHEMAAARHRVLSVVTVRHPFDSFLAIVRNKWLHFSPPSAEEYARRYLAFLDHHADIPVVRYEDFVQTPEAVLQQICGHLKLAYGAQSLSFHHLFQLSGDSGRSSEIIEPRPRRPYPPELAAEIAASPSFVALIERLSYKPVT